MEGHHHLHHHHQHLHQHQQQQQQQQQQHHISSSVDAASSDRFPQWSVQETKEFLMIRAELDQTFMEKKRNKVLWELIANKMKEHGFNRSAEQCKCKWQNLVTRYKGCETMEPEALRQQFPFYNEMQAIFGGRMQRMLWAEAEGAAVGSKKKAVELSSDEEDDMNEESDHGDHHQYQKGTTGSSSVVRKRKKAKIIPSSVVGGGGGGGSIVSSLKEVLDGFLKQQVQMERQWREAYEAREKERVVREMEWRQKMEAVENEKMMLDRRWREREEQRRMREEARAEKRDALITELLNKLRREDNV